MVLSTLSFLREVFLSRGQKEDGHRKLTHQSRSDLSLARHTLMGVVEGSDSLITGDKQIVDDSLTSSRSVRRIGSGWFHGPSTDFSQTSVYGSMRRENDIFPPLSLSTGWWLANLAGVEGNPRRIPISKYCSKKLWHIRETIFKKIIQFGSFNELLVFSSPEESFFWKDSC